MKDYKVESSSHQVQLDRMRKEMDNLVKDYRQSNVNNISQEQHERIIRYLQSRLNDLRDENLTLRDRFKSTSYLQQQIGNQMHSPKTFSETEYQSSSGSGYNNTIIFNSVGRNNGLPDDDMSALYTPSVDGEDQLESKNELLQQKLNELQKLQMQLNNVQT